MSKISLIRLFWFILKGKNPISEIDLLRGFFPGYRNIVKNGLSEELFHIHFSLYNRLYRLADALKKTPWHLHIENMYVYLLFKPRKGNCGFFDAASRSFCMKRTTKRGDRYCTVHQEGEARDKLNRTVSSLRTYYLDMKNDNDTEARRIITISQGMLKSEQKPATAAEPLGSHPSNLQYSSDRLERRYWHMASTYEDVCTGFIGDFTEFNRAYMILSELTKEDPGTQGMDFL